MVNLVLIIILLIIIIINYLYLTKKKTAMEIVNDMGIGYNLGNSFDCFKNLEIIKNPNDLITSKGNPIPTRDLIVKLKMFGFKTIRFPVTWLNFIDENDNINNEWFKRVKEVVDWIINENMYCILNMHHDGYNDGYNVNWLSEGVKAKDKYINLWSQIANEFKEYDEYLIFESMNNLEIYSLTYDKEKDRYIYDYDYKGLNILTQAFVDTIRNSGGKNIERLLLISGANDYIEYTCSSKYKLPIDPYNKISVSMHNYIPYDFTYIQSYEFKWLDEIGNEHITSDLRIWGEDKDYNEMISIYETIKKAFIDKGIPVIIGEVGVLTEEKKEIKSIREYLYFQFSMSHDYDGIMSCLWDTSNKNFGNMNFIDREKMEWYDDKIKYIVKRISNNKNVKPKDYFIKTNKITVSTLSYGGMMTINFGDKDVIKIIFDVNINVYYSEEIHFKIISYNKNGDLVLINVGNKYRRRSSDGTYIYSYNVSNYNITNMVEIENLYKDISLNYLTVEFKEEFLFIDNFSYKNDISRFIE